MPQMFRQKCLYLSGMTDLFVIKIFTAWRLGMVNIGRALLYRIGVRLGVNPVRKLVERAPIGHFFDEPNSDLLVTSPAAAYVPDAFGLKMRFPSHGDIPLWHNSVLTGGEVELLPWWRLPDFIEGVGDIKGVWEVSRFDWVLAFAKQVLAGDKKALHRLNDWLSDWCEKNPPYYGVNWKCGQEASIRVMHLSMAAQMLGQVVDPPAGLMDILRVHLCRIAPTIQYAIAQDNNHGTSEAAALFIGGSWLAAQYDGSNVAHEAENWVKQGRKWLENRAKRLIEPDGSFSQYSLNYHRVMLDSYSMAELWRMELGLSPFSQELVSRLQRATAWLGNMVSPDGEDTPNWGANDGARLLPLADSDYRDVRPSVQLASVLFAGARAFEAPGVWDQPLQWLRVSTPERSLNYISSRQYDDGGIAIIRDGKAMLLFRYPRFRFRPGQSDLLHVDFWLGSKNLLRDGGSFSYNCKEPWQSYFPGSSAHNTVQFDHRDAMPRLSRFLFGAWPKALNVENLSFQGDCQSIAAGYCDWKGAAHHRSISLSGDSLTVTDEIKNFECSAVLRWRLSPGEWRWENGWLVCDGIHIRVETSLPVKRCELVKGWESRYYSRKTALPVLEVEVEKPGRLITELRY